jgi:hypothetical protein
LQMYFDVGLGIGKKNITFRGSSATFDRQIHLQKLEKERQERELARKKQSAAIKLQSVFRSYRGKQPL